MAETWAACLAAGAGSLPSQNAAVVIIVVAVIIPVVVIIVVIVIIPVVVIIVVIVITLNRATRKLWYNICPNIRCCNASQQQAPTRKVLGPGW